ncbi:Zinc Transporter Zip9 [Manis pentadactyla]|nr:Zinc Transporter Zip9 [Manis pentadactyla]
MESSQTGHLGNLLCGSIKWYLNQGMQEAEEPASFSQWAWLCVSHKPQMGAVSQPSCAGIAGPRMRKEELGARGLERKEACCLTIHCLLPLMALGRRGSGAAGTF